MPVRGLTIILTGTDPDRLRSALGMAASQAALGGPARLFLDGVSARLLVGPVAAPLDEQHRAAGLPTLAELLETALVLGVSISLCQSGLAMAGIGADTIDPRLRTGGMTGMMATIGDDRLIAL
jgi:predicted peroxiredoxin